VEDLPEAHPDGVCADCSTKDAVTRDGRFCLTCLRKRLREDEPPVRDLNRRGSDQIGRSARSTQALGGAAKTVGDGDD